MMLPYPVIVSALALVFCVLSFSCMVLTIVWRIRNVKQDRAWEHAKEKWNPIFAKSTAEIPEFLPSIESNAERHDVLTLWCEYRAALRGESAQNLNRLAMRLSLDEYCIILLSSGSVSNQFLAIVALGCLGIKRAYDVIQRRVALRDPILSFVAARAIAQIDSERSLVWLLPVMAERKDWHKARLLTLFHEAGPQIILKHLPSYILDNDDARSARLVPFLRLLPSESFAPIVTRILARTHSTNIKEECRALLKGMPLWQDEDMNAKEIATLNPLAFDPRLGVRVPAIKTGEKPHGKHFEEASLSELPEGKDSKAGQEKT